MADKGINKINKEDNKEKISDNSKMFNFSGIIALLFSLFIIFTAIRGPFPNLIQRSIFIGFGLVLSFFIRPTYRGKNKFNKILDILFVLFSICSTVWVIINYDRFMMETTSSSWLDLTLAVVVIILILEATRRIIGPVFAFLTILSISYAIFGPWFPGDFAHKGFSLVFMLQHLYITSRGIWGLTTGIMASIVAIFIIFGQIISSTGGAEAFFSFAMKLSAKQTGGPAKVAVIGSSLFGMLSGSAAANSAIIGGFTIPMMKRVGYKAEFAAATEAVAGTGGQIMPPIMGAGAFIIAERLSIPYIEVAIAAFIPAVIYFIGVFSTIHFRSLKRNLRGLKDSEMPDIKKGLTFHNIMHLVVPTVVLVFFIAKGYTVAKAGVYSIILAFILYVFKDIRIEQIKNSLKDILNALVKAGKGLVLIALLGGCADIIIGMISLTGLGVKLSSAIYSLSGGYLFLALFFTMIVALILGMGLPTTASYILASSVTVPALVEFNLLPLSAHMFVLYFAAISAITPPVCAAVFITSGIANSNWLKTGFIAVGMGISAFIVPFIFVYANELLMVGSWYSILLLTSTTILGTILLAGGLMGNLFIDIDYISRIAFIICGILIMIPNYATNLLGIIVGGLFLIYNLKRFKKDQKLQGMSEIN
jgi:TRAP transporter 4TM/12TM fusion protein